MDSTSQLQFKIIESTLFQYSSHKTFKKTQKFPFLIDYEKTKQIVPNNTADYAIRTYSIGKFRIKTQIKFKDPLLLKKQEQIDDEPPSAYYEFKIAVFDDGHLDRTYTEINPNQTASVKIYLLHKYQRIKLTFSQSIDYIKTNLNQLKAYLNKQTGYKAHVDLIRNHTYSPHNSSNNNETWLYDFENKTVHLTDVYLHFIDEINITEANNTHDNRVNFNIVSAEKVISLLDKSKDLTLIRKYRLVLAEQYDSENEKEVIHRFNDNFNSSIGDSDTEQYLISSDQLDAVTLSSAAEIAQNLLIKLLLMVLSIILTVLILFILILCYLMRRKYRHKLKIERAIIKTFDLNNFVTSKYNSNLFNYTNKTYLNDDLDDHNNTTSNNNTLLNQSQRRLSQIPGTNLYTYDGTNPVWLGANNSNKTYDKIETTTSSSQATSSSTSSTASSFSKAIDTYKINHKNHRMIETANNTNTNAEIKTFYLKQTDSTLPSVASIAAANKATTVVTVKKKAPTIASINSSSEFERLRNDRKQINCDKTMSFTSNESNNGESSRILKDSNKESIELMNAKKNKTSNGIQLNDLSFNIKTSEIIMNHDLTMLNRVDSIKYNKKKNLSSASTPLVTTTSLHQTGIDDAANTSDLIKLQDSIDDTINTPVKTLNLTNNLNQSNKDCNDLYALESTII